MLVFPNAKINIGLRILRKRKDGYHDIQTVFYPIPLKDALEAVPSGKKAGSAELTVTGLPLSRENNLVLKAYRLLHRLYDLPGIRVHLHKMIPPGAGLGGGSSDAAHMLALLNNMFRLAMESGHLFRHAALLGSDCPFFISNRPSLGSGRGEKLQPLPFSLRGYFLLLLVAPVQINTARAYRETRAGPRNEKPATKDRSPDKLVCLPPGDWKERIGNDFEPYVFENYPLIRELKDKLYRSGALYASLTGSGSGVYGIFRESLQPEGLPPEVMSFNMRL